MPVFIRPIVPTSNKKQYVIAPDGSVLDVGLMPVSKDAKNLLTVDDEGLCVKASDIVSRSPDNMLSVGADGGLFISSTISPEISADEYNYARIGRDGGLFISGNDILSNGDINLLTIDPTDHKIILTRAGLLKAMPLVSTDKGNVISSGSDGGAYLAIDDLIADDDPLLFVNGDKQIATSIKLKYNPGNGALDLIGQNGDVITSVTVPTSTSSLKGVYLLNGKPDAMGATTAGDYHFSLQYSMDNGISWGAPVPVTVTATKGMESAGTLPGVEGVNKVRAFFHDLQAESIVSANKATLVFSDETNLTVTPGIEETTFTFMPAVGIETGVFLCFVFLLSDGTVQDVYVDLSTLVDVYAPGDGISITAGDVPIISTKVKDDGGILVDGTGLYVDEEWLEAHAPAPKEGNGISISGSTVSVKPNENGGIIVDNLGVSVNVAEGGGLVVDGTGVHIDESWLADNAFKPVEGNGITISGNTVSVKAKPNGGITVDSAGVGIDTDWLFEQFTGIYISGEGIDITGNTISVEVKGGGGLETDADGVYIEVAPDGGLETTTDGIGIKVDPNGGLETSDAGAIVKTDPDGGLITGPDGTGIDPDWLKQQVTEYETKYEGGDGISITDTSDQTRTITAVAAPDGGLTVADTGISVDLDGGSDFPSGLEIKEVGNLGVKEGSGIGITSEGVSVRYGDGLTLDEGGRLIVDDTVLRTNKEQTITATKTFDIGYFGKTVAVEAMDISPVDGAVFTKTVTINTTFTISGTPSNVAACFTLVLTNGGSHTVTWPSSVKWTEGTPPELIAAGIDVITFITPNGGITWYGCHSVQGVPAE